MFMLQFAVKGVIEDKSEGVPIETEIHFAYWGALIALGIAGFICYLRMKKNHTITVGNPQQENPVRTESIIQPQNSNLNTQESFDTLTWLNRNYKKIVIGCAIILTLDGGGFYIYKNFLIDNPLRDGKTAAEELCDCRENQSQSLLKIKQDFLKSFNYKTQIEARNKLQETILQNDRSQECFDLATEKHGKLRTKYISNKALLDNFDDAFISISQSCSDKFLSEHNLIDKEIEKKILVIKEFGEQPSTAKINFKPTEHPLVDLYIGEIGDKDFKLFIDSVVSNQVFGYNITGTNRRPVKGTFWVSEQKGEIINPDNPADQGIRYDESVYHLSLQEPGDDKWDGEFTLDLTLSDVSRTGDGNWKAYNGKLDKSIKGSIKKIV